MPSSVRQWSAATIFIVVALALLARRWGMSNLVREENQQMPATVHQSDRRSCHSRPAPIRSTKALANKELLRLLDKDRLRYDGHSLSVPLPVEIGSLDENGKLSLKAGSRNVVMEAIFLREPNYHGQGITSSMDADAYFVFDPLQRRLNSKAPMQSVVIPMLVGAPGKLGNIGLVGKAECSVVQSAEKAELDPCLHAAGYVTVPIGSIASVVDLLPQNVTIGLLSIDMNGYDLVAVSTLGMTNVAKLGYLEMSCSDQPASSYEERAASTHTCGEQVACLTKEWGLAQGGCWRLNSDDVASPFLVCTYRGGMTLGVDVKAHIPLRVPANSKVVEVQHQASCPMGFSEGFKRGRSDRQR